MLAKVAVNGQLAIDNRQLTRKQQTTHDRPKTPMKRIIHYYVYLYKNFCNGIKKIFGKLNDDDRDRSSERYKCFWESNGGKVDVLDGHSRSNRSPKTL